MSRARGKHSNPAIPAVPRSGRRRPAVTIAAVPETPETPAVALAEPEPTVAPSVAARPWQRLRRPRLPRPRLALRWPARAPRRPLERHPGLYGVLGVAPTATAAEIHFAYRSQAAGLARSRFARPKELRELNAAYEVLGNPARRRDYDYQRAAVTVPALPSASGRPSDQVAGTTHYPRLRHAHRDRRSQPAFTDLVGVAVVLVTAVVAAYMILSRVDVDLSPLNAMGGLLGLRGSGRPATIAEVPITAVTPTVVVPTPAPGETPLPQPTPLPLQDQFDGSSLTLSDSQPPQGTTVTALVRLQRNGQPVADVPVYVTATYRTTSERWPSSGPARTDARGAAAIPFNIGDATRGFEVKVVAHADVEGTDLTWESAFTPR